MTRLRSVDDPRTDQTPPVGQHRPAILPVPSDTDCRMRTCGHKPGRCPTHAAKVCEACSEGDPEIAMLMTATTWPCAVARYGPEEDR